MSDERIQKWQSGKVTKGHSARLALSLRLPIADCLLPVPHSATLPLCHFATSCFLFRCRRRRRLRRQTLVFEFE